MPAKNAKHYLEMLEHSYKITIEETHGCPPENRLSFLANDIFEIITYDDSMSEFFGRKAVEVCRAITNRTTFEYIKDPDDYKWFLMMCNLPFFASKIEWGSSLRGAWWDSGPDFQYVIDSCNLYIGNEQLGKLEIDDEQWPQFMEAIFAFVAEETSNKTIPETNQKKL